MRSLRNWVVGFSLASMMACLAPGCGGGANSGLAKIPETKPGPPDMSAMPGYDPVTKSMKPAGK